MARDEYGDAVSCSGAECPAQLQRNITHFAGRDAMDIEGLGPEEERKQFRRFDQLPLSNYTKQGEKE